jgi:predicted ATP-grasp superfamily ATP-dependent carboligase
VTRTAASTPAGGTGPAAIVIGLDCITGLQTARLLARRGVPVIGIASNPGHFCARTRVCQEILQADTASEELLLALEREAGRFPEPPVLFPCTDNSVRLLSAGRDRLAGYRLALPEHDVVEMLIEKPSMERYAREHGFRVPNTVEIGRREDLEAACGELRFPCVLKPASKDARWVAHTSQKAFEVADAESLLARYDACAGWSDRFIVQEWIEGPESALYSCNVYFSSGAEPLVAFVARKIRQWPPSTGTSALGVECRADEVCEETLRLFRSVGYHGLGYVEMKFDERTGHYSLIEPNVGRPTGRSAMAWSSSTPCTATSSGFHCRSGAPRPSAAPSGSTCVTTSRPHSWRGSAGNSACGSGGRRCEGRRPMRSSPRPIRCRSSSTR